MAYKMHMVLIILTLLLLSSLPTLSDDKSSVSVFEPLAARYTLRGDAYFKGSGISLLRKTSPTWGAMVSDHPFSLIDHNGCFSFKSEFSFSFKMPTDPASYGEGLAFFISHDNLAVPSPEPFGVPKHFIGILFDIRSDSDSHFGGESKLSFVVNSLHPFISVDPTHHGFDLFTTEITFCWIEYTSGGGSGSVGVDSLNVFLSASSLKPTKPVVTVSVDLCMYFEEYPILYHGISASSLTAKENSEVWEISSMNFESFKNDRWCENSSDVGYIITIVVLVVVVLVLGVCFIYVYVKGRRVQSALSGIELFDMNRLRAAVTDYMMETPQAAVITENKPLLNDVQVNHTTEDDVSSEDTNEDNKAKKKNSEIAASPFTPLVIVKPAGTIEVSCKG